MPEKYYVRGDSKSNYESMTKEEIAAAIMNAIQSGTIGDIDAGFITKIKELNNGEKLSFWVGTSAEFNALEQQEPNVLYIKTDDTSPEDIGAALEQLTAKTAAHDSQLSDITLRFQADENDIEDLQEAVTALGQTIKARGAWVFGVIAAGSSEDTGNLFTISDEAMEQADRMPAVFVSPVLSSNQTYNPDLQYFGYVIDNGEGNGGTLVLGVRNNGTSAAQPPDVAAVVI